MTGWNNLLTAAYKSPWPRLSCKNSNLSVVSRQSAENVIKQKGLAVDREFGAGTSIVPTLLTLSGCCLVDISSRFHCELHHCDQQIMAVFLSGRCDA